MKYVVISGTTVCNLSIMKIIKKHSEIRKKKISRVNAIKKLNPKF